MTTLFSNITIVTMDDANPVIENGFLLVSGGKIAYVGKERPQEKPDRVIDGKNRLIMPGLINTHTHGAMSLLRGYADDYCLQDWLFKHVFPAEAKLTREIVLAGNLLAIAEMIASGTTSFTDMYFFIDTLAEAVMDTGIKANISNGVTCFDPDSFDFLADNAVKETADVFGRFHMADGGRLRVDMGIHAEYTSYPDVWQKSAAFAKEHSLNVHLHLSETKREHDECVQKYGKTPARLFYDNGVFDQPATAAHCVWVTEEDMELLAEKGVSAAHCPVSNLKLGCGIAPVTKLLERGVNVTLGTDGACSCNNLDLFEGLKLAAILQKTAVNDASAMPAYQALKLATVSGAKAQGRQNECGMFKEGFDADIVMLNTDKPHLTPVYSPVSNIVYSAGGSDVAMTMVRGSVLYENGKYKTLDIEKIMADAKRTARDIF